ncbi:zinc transporter Zip99C isoform X5 [Rhipicephalus microplus]|uniref:zinc transporter Zip99C isoform X5 n=1 Tax=Rhipicephalus microplus TaxID=6941 RepID=UPI003F6BD953
MPLAAQLLRLGVVAAAGNALCGDERSSNVSFVEGTPLLRVWQLWSPALEHSSSVRAPPDVRTYQTWVFSIVAACVVGLSGVFPLLLVPLDTGVKQNRNGCRTLKLLLSFAVGGLLGDVFLHLLPEAWGRLQRAGAESPAQAHLTLGLWVLLGVFTFIILELVFSATGPNVEQTFSHSDVNRNGLDKPVSTVQSFKAIHMGMVTTLAILIHEIPHEVGDFAILLKSGFNRWDAAKAQVITAAVGVAGAVTALSADSLEDMDTSTSWILPFTSGGFLNIALVSVLPDLLKEEDPWQMQTGLHQRVHTTDWRHEMDGRCLWKALQSA